MIDRDWMIGGLTCSEHPVFVGQRQGHTTGGGGVGSRTDSPDNRGRDQRAGRGLGLWRLIGVLGEKPQLL